MIYVAKRDLARLLQENLHLSKQVTELQTAGTQLVLEMRRLAKHEFDLPVRQIAHTVDGQEITQPLPEYQTAGAAGFDLHAAVPAQLPAGGRRKIPTGIAIELPEGYTAKVLPRSGFVDKDGVIAVDGTIDADYRGEVHVLLINISHDAKTIKEGTRIGQLLILPIMRARLVPTETLGETERGDKGFGSTGE